MLTSRRIIRIPSGAESAGSLFKSEKVDHVRGSRSRWPALGRGCGFRLQIKPFVWVTRRFIWEPDHSRNRSGSNLPLGRERSKLELKSLIMAQIERWRQA